MDKHIFPWQTHFLGSHLGLQLSCIWVNRLCRLHSAQFFHNQHQTYKYVHWANIYHIHCTNPKQMMCLSTLP